MVPLGSISGASWIYHRKRYLEGSTVHDACLMELVPGSSAMGTVLRVLVIDDDPAVRSGFSLLLSSQGYEVFEADTGARGVQLAHDMEPDIILLDVVLPDMDGFDVCRQILADSAVEAPMITMISGLNKDVDNRVRGYEAGAIDYVSKPVQGRELLAKLASLASVHTAGKKLRQDIQEKELVMRKLHHRIKNDLTLVESMIDLRQSELKDPSVHLMLEDFRSRIRSIMAVHECLYRSGDLESIAGRSFFDELVRNLYRFLHGRSDTVKLEVQVDDCTLDADHAMALGMVATELVANAVRHGYPQGCNGTVALSLIRTGSTLDLIVEDDGCGFPRGFDFSSGSALGLALVKSIVDNHNGSMTINPANPTRFHICFPFEKTAPDVC
jgi:two-component sensor histidine kinase